MRAGRQTHSGEAACRQAGRPTQVRPHACRQLLLLTCMLCLVAVAGGAKGGGAKARKKGISFAGKGKADDDDDDDEAMDTKLQAMRVLEKEKMAAISAGVTGGGLGPVMDDDQKSEVGVWGGGGEIGGELRARVCVGGGDQV